MAYFGGVLPKRLPLWVLAASSTVEDYAVAATRKKPTPRDNDARARRAVLVSSLPLLTAVPKYGSRTRK